MLLPLVPLNLAFAAATVVVVEFHGDLLEQNPCLIHAVTLRVCNEMAPSCAIRCVGELDRDIGLGNYFDLKPKVF